MNPNTGEIYEGELRDKGDIRLSPAEHRELKLFPREARVKRLGEMRDLDASAKRTKKRKTAKASRKRNRQ